MSIMFGETASISLITALPGSGKTLRFVTWLKSVLEEAKKPRKADALVPVTLIYISLDRKGEPCIKGLKLPHIICEDPRKWQELPPGSILVVDEAQDWFPARRAGDPPEHISEMSRIRHHGVRLLLATQQPDYLDKYLRGLVGLHEHMLRENGKEASKIWRNNEVMPDVTSVRARERYDSETWNFPKENYELYVSAEVHTVKRKVTSKFKRGAIALGVVALLGAAIAWRIPGILDPGIKEANASEVAGEVSGRPTAGRAGSRSRLPPDASPAEWAGQFEPRIKSIPASAPAFDSLPILSKPKLACVIGERLGCICLTEQGTRWPITRLECRDLVEKGGTYDYHRAPVVEREPVKGTGEKLGVGQRPTVTPSVVGIGQAGDLVAPQGQFRDGT